MKKLIIVTLICTPIAACQGVGPRTQAILDSENAIKVESNQEEAFVLVEVNGEIAEKIAKAAPNRTTARFVTSGQTSPVVIGAGDVLDISIVSTNENGFIDFTQSSISPVSTTDLPTQTVGTDGNVNVPPLGRVNARGQSVQQFETFLTRRLGEVLIKPSVIVNLTDRKSARVSVLGEVAQPGSFSINQDSQHLVDVITLAGGPTSRPEDLTVSLSRKGSTATVGVDQLLANPKYNVHVRPGDIINVESSRSTYTILGASGNNSTQDFSRATFSLADALGRAGGLQNRQADREGVFLFRETPKSLVASLGADTSNIKTTMAPTIFQFDLSQPTSVFTIAKFQIQDGDIIYISNSRAEEINAAIGAFTNFIPAPVEYVRDATIN